MASGWGYLKDGILGSVADEKGIMNEPTP
jgi:hypothetical protein